MIDSTLSSRRHSTLGSTSPTARRTATAVDAIAETVAVLLQCPLPDRVYLKTEAHLLCPSDVSLNNFLWDPVTERVWMIDCQHVNVLPQSFASFYFHHTTDPFVKAVAERINLPVSSQLALVESAASFCRAAIHPLVSMSMATSSYPGETSVSRDCTR
ncbi:unnamed protein product [Cyclocybe aegerita]|uniref:Uncharacterized protein n=1 Tax=Cyclocybe aegerita TaxID=1973307 RepID=A0A8S0VTZ1_CYCAE|nr:unnamed protein product [Cyclocybe aegerita]